MINANQIDLNASYSVELYKQLVPVQWHLGGIHKNVELSVNPLHKFVFRATFGRGLEAINSDHLRPKWRANELQYFAPGCEHQHTTEMASDWVVITLTDDIFDTILEEMDVDSDIRGLELEECSFVAEVLADSSRHIRSHIVNHSQSNLLDFEAIVADFINSALKIMYESNTADTHICLTQQVLNRVFDFVESNLSNSINLEQLAKVSGYSHFHFAKAFKSATGHSPHNYVLTRRIENSRTLLSQTNRTLAEIAFITGFSSQAHFQMVFKRMIGTTPMAYRGLKSIY